MKSKGSLVVSKSGSTPDIKRLIHDAISFNREKNEGPGNENMQTANDNSPSNPRVHARPPQSNPPVTSGNPPETTNSKSFPGLRKYNPLIEVVGVGAVSY